MPGTLLVGAEGVVVLPDQGNYAAGVPIMEGIEVVSLLSQGLTSRVVIMVNTSEIENAQYFCRMNGLHKAGVVGCAPEDNTFTPPFMAQWHTVQRERSHGPINLVLTAFPQVYRRCLGTHQSGLLFGRRGVLQALEGIEPWTDLTAAMQRRREAEIEDEEDDERPSTPIA